MAALKALLISDGRPGHFHLAEGILAAAGRVRPLDITTIEARRPRWLTPGLLWRLSTSGLSPALILGYAYGIDAAALPEAKLVVSAGGDTLAANIASARLLGAENVFYGSLRRYAPESFGLVLTSYARNAAKPRHVMTLKPSRLDPDTLGPTRSGSNQAIQRLGLLVGGDAGTVRYRTEDWDRLLAFIGSQHKAAATRWIASNSPRTPPLFSDALLRLSKAPGGPIAEFIDVRTAGTGTLAHLFAHSDGVVCTADSSSMLSEVVWARRPAISVFPAGMSLPADEMDYRRYLETSGWARSIPIAALSPDRFAAELGAIRPLESNPLDLLAEILKRELPAVFATP